MRRLWRGLRCGVAAALVVAGVAGAQGLAAMTPGQYLRGILYVGPDAPELPDCYIGSLWVDLTANLLKRCTSLSPVTFVSTEGGGGGAPTGAEYLTGAADATLTAERVVTDTPTGAWDLATAGQAKVNVPDNAITDAKLRDAAAVSVIGRAAGTVGDPADIAAAADDRVLLRSGGVLSFSRAALAALADVATARLLGRTTAGAGVIEELTAAQATALLDVFTAALKGLTPASGGGTTNFLRADATWAVPAGGTGATLTRINGASGAAGADFTVQRLTANSADVTTVALSAAIMTTTGLGAGLWKAKWCLICQTAATTTGIGFGINHTGTVGEFRALVLTITTGAAAATGVADSDTAVVAGQMAEGKQEGVLNAVIGSTFAGVDTINTDFLVIVNALIEVTVSGDLELKIASEVAGSAVRVMAQSLLELVKVA